jgi:hypothetical protein
MPKRRRREMAERKPDGGKQRKRPQEIYEQWTDRLEKAVCHPLRAKLLAKYNEQAYSPSELAELLGEKLNSVSYHTNVLRKYKCVELVDREMVRGAEKTTYRGVTRMVIDDNIWKKLKPNSKTGISIKAVGETFERIQKAIEAGTFDSKDDRVVVNHKVSLDDEGWSEAVGIMREAHERIEALEPDAINRTPDSLGRHRFTLTLLAYESPPGVKS